MHEMPQLDKNALQRLLEEREQDLQLAAQIGQTLLERNEDLESSLLTAIRSKEALQQQADQLRHDIGLKEQLLRLYIRHANEADMVDGDQTSPGNRHPFFEDDSSSVEWAKLLQEECQGLQTSNQQLREEADRLRMETSSIEQKERELVSECLKQLADSNERIKQLREDLDMKIEEKLSLSKDVHRLTQELTDMSVLHHQLSEDNEMLREQLHESQALQAQLSNEVLVLTERYEHTSNLMKELQEELNLLQSNSSGCSSPQPSEFVEHESVVKEIEEAVRKEMMEASMLQERPESPNSYVQARTNVVMKTVRAATEASTKKLERLAMLHNRYKKKAEFAARPSEQGLNILAEKRDTGDAVKNDGKASTQSDDEKSNKKNRSFDHGSSSSHSVGGRMFLPKGTSSPIGSRKGLMPPHEYQEDFKKYRAPFMAPEKLQIVKPLEGSVTLLKWKLLATPQLGGATSYFSNMAHPGIHMKSWRGTGHSASNSKTSSKTQSHDASAVSIDGDFGSSVDGDTAATMSPLATANTSAHNASSLSLTASPSSRHAAASKRSGGIHSRINSSAGSRISGMNDISSMLLNGNNNNNNNSNALENGGTMDNAVGPSLSEGALIMNTLRASMGPAWQRASITIPAIHNTGLASILDDEVDP